MLVTPYQLQDIIYFMGQLPTNTAVAFDFETTGLSPYKGDTAIIMSLAYQDRCYSVFLNEISTQHLRNIFSFKDLRYVAHNAKFELSFLREQYGIEVMGDVWCTQTMERLIDNEQLSYSLAACASRSGLPAKHQLMIDWLKSNKGRLFTDAPTDILVPYVELDAVIALALYEKQRQVINYHGMQQLARTEMKVTRILHDMESMGMLVDREYTREAAIYETQLLDETYLKLSKLCGAPFVDSAKFLAPKLFELHNITLPQTEKGNPSLAAEVLEQYKEHALVDLILTYRHYSKRVSTYWETFEKMLTINSTAHFTIRQAGAATGRFSSTPNAQNWPANDDKEAYPIRRAFVARPDCKIVSIDYAQMELRLMVDEARELGMAHDITSGVDFHQRVADSAGVTRNVAKTARFAALYGASAKRLGITLGCSEGEAKRIKAALERDTPMITQYSHKLRRQVETTGILQNAFGRRYTFADRKMSYKAPNYRIQGGCGDILRRALIGCDHLLKTRRKSLLSTMLIPIHDEIVFNLHTDDLDLIPFLRHEMIVAYTGDILSMNVSVAIGDNFHDLEDM
ncbi:MAG: hypothetical protein IPL34_20350 [Thiofilum sp.]|uniref:DNA polymerase n=1 Tax=Thiofilum sp. TaxID=2212733 RepID=UPI0025F26517|nr:DNA polymerase [Thiofilum sp.]MBK8455634.1 hypothetical protein [Thiofilum sp.]